jgi:hypothetical protein
MSALIADYHVLYSRPSHPGGRAWTGEIGIAGVAATITNAAFNARGSVSVSDAVASSITIRLTRLKPMGPPALC